MTREDRFKQQWLNRRFKCNTTGEVLELKANMIKECAFIQWGESYIDLGRLDFYCRFSNCTEIVEEE